MYDGQLSFVAIYKVGKCMMPSFFKSDSDFKLCSVFQTLVFNGFLTFNTDINSGVIRPGFGLNKTLIKSFIRDSD